MSKRIWISIIALALMGGWYGLTQTRTETKVEHIKVGVIIPETGNFASIGEKIKRGLELAKLDLEGKYKNIQIDLIYENACLPQEAITATQKLVMVDRVKIIGAQFCVPGLIPSLQITESAKVINVGIAASSNELLNKNYYFSPNFSIKQNSTDLAEYAIKDLKAKRAAFMYYDTQLGKDYREEIGRKFQALGGQIVADEMTPLAQTDFRTSLTKIKAANPDVIFMTQITVGLGNALKQANDLHINAKIIGNPSNEDEVMLSIAGKAADGFLFSSADPMILGRNSGFERSFRAKYNNATPEYFSGNAYDALSLEIPAYLKCKGNTDCIMSELHQIRNYQGASGEISISEQGIASKPVVFKVVSGGRFVPAQ